MSNKILVVINKFKEMCDLLLYSANESNNLIYSGDKFKPSLAPVRMIVSLLNSFFTYLGDSVSSTKSNHLSLLSSLGHSCNVQLESEHKLFFSGNIARYFKII